MKVQKILSAFSFIFLFSSLKAQVSDEQIYKLSQVLNNVSRYYTDSINEDKIIENTIVSTLKQLDPHSSYFSKEDVEEINRGLEGSFVGIGITYSMLRDTVLILSVLPDGPSEKAGLLPGDRILKVENMNLAGVKATDKLIRESLVGEKGTKVDISIKRKSTKSNLLLSVTRDNIQVSSIDAAYMATDGVGYIKLSRFSASSTDDFNKALLKLKKQGAESLIFDLRGNGGGYLNTAVEIVNNFLEKDRMIVYTEGVKSPRKDYISTEEGLFKTGKVAVLIDEGTASASEIVSGAIQDWDRGVIIGRRSYGKGLVQRPFYLVDGSMMRLTVARYYTPGGRCIQKPYNKGFEEYSEDLINRKKHGELMHADSIKFNDSLKYRTLINRRSIYGGGGIMPDIFIPLDTTLYPDFYLKWLNSDKITNFVHDYVDQHRQFLKLIYPTFTKFNTQFNVDDNLYKELFFFAENIKNMTQNNSSNISVSDLRKHEMIGIHLKALIANDLWNSDEYWQVMNPWNEIYKKALDVIGNNRSFNSVLAQK
jgi:carboxyl-terminal processing protease